MDIRKASASITIRFGDQEGYNRTPIDARNAAHAHDAEMQKRGVLLGIAGEPVQVRNPDATKVDVASGPFMSSALPIAGFAIIEAADIS